MGSARDNFRDYRAFSAEMVALGIDAALHLPMWNSYEAWRQQRGRDSSNVEGVTTW